MNRQMMKAPLLIPFKISCVFFSFLFFIPENLVLAETATVDNYGSLLQKFPKEHQGRGYDPYSKEGVYTDQAETYGLILMAETAHFKWDQNPESKERINQAVDWLIKNTKKENGQFVGWGLPDAWDAFSDGTVNPPHHVYTIINSMIMLSLLDYLTLPGAHGGHRSRKIKKILRSVSLYSCRHTWTDDGLNSHFWYSASPNDAYFVLNVSAMFAGVLTRTLREQRSLFSEPEEQLIKSTVDKAVQGVVSKTIWRNNIPYWNYIEKPNTANQDSPNDLVHHAYILFGLELYRSNQRDVELPWSLEQAVTSLDQFWKDGFLFDYPQDIAYKDEKIAFNHRPTKLWGAGTMAAFYATWGYLDKAERCLAFVYKEYGDWPDIHMWPMSFSMDARFYPRYTSHVLWGLSKKCFPDLHSAR